LLENAVAELTATEQVGEASIKPQYSETVPQHKRANEK